MCVSSLSYSIQRVENSPDSRLGPSRRFLLEILTRKNTLSYKMSEDMRARPGVIINTPAKFFVANGLLFGGYLFRP